MKIFKLEMNRNDLCINNFLKNLFWFKLFSFGFVDMKKLVMNDDQNNTTA